MVTPVSTKRNQRSLDDESQIALYEGLNQSQLAVAFGMDIRTIQRKIHGLHPSGIRNGSKVWKLADVTPYLVKPRVDIETYIKNMNHNELPKHLTKEFWAGQRARQDYLLKEGDLWPTTQVVEKVSELMKLMSMSLKLLADTVDRQSELTEKQRKVILSIVDSTQTDLVRTVQEHFSKVEPKQQPKVESEVTFNDDEDDSL